MIIKIVGCQDIQTHPVKLLLQTSKSLLNVHSSNVFKLTVGGQIVNLVICKVFEIECQSK